MAPSSPAPSKMRVTRRWCHSAWPLREGKDFFGRVGLGSMGGASTEMAASEGNPTAPSSLEPSKTGVTGRSCQSLWPLSEDGCFFDRREIGIDSGHAQSKGSCGTKFALYFIELDDSRRGDAIPGALEALEKLSSPLEAGRMILGEPAVALR